MRYSGRGRHLVLALKHSDRTDIAPGAASMMHRAAQDIITTESVFVPVPLHWTRLAKRRYNQSALLAQALAKQSGAQAAVGALHRPKRTRSLGGLNADARARELDAAIVVAQTQAILSRHVVIVDDVLTSGATLRACARAILQAGAAHVDIVVLARAAPQA
jgi:ComF family protein